MKEKKNHLKKLFGDFEPEASNARIDEGWEKMRYFLPQEKKRRGAAYLFGCLGIGSILLVALVASWFVFKDHTASVATVFESEKHNEGKFSGPAVKSAESSAPGVNKIPLHTTLPAVKKADVIKPSSPGKNGDASDKSKIAHQNADPVMQQADLDVTPEHNKPVASQQQPVVNEPEGTLATVDTSRVPVATGDDDYYYNPDEQLKAILSETATTFYLPNIPPHYFSPDTGYIAPELIPIRRPVVPPPAAFNLMVFGGPNVTHTALKDLSYSEKKQNSLGISAGLALSYQFKNKLSIVGQAVYSESKLTYEHVQVEKRGFPGQLFVNIFDTNLVSTISRVASSSGYNMGLGLGYQLYGKARVELDGFALLNWRVVKYTFTEMDSTGVRKNATTTNGFSFQTVSTMPANFPRPDTRVVQTVNTIGITAGMTLSYRFYKNLFVIFRPSYCFQLPNDKGAFGDRFLIRRNMLYFDLGLRLKLERSAR